MQTHPLMIVGTFVCLAWSVVSAGAASPEPLFERDIRPILKAHCWHCHGEGGEREGNLDARRARWLRDGGDSGPAIEAGDHEASLLYQRVFDGDMPPGDKRLSDEEIQRLAEWIDAGAKTARPEPDSFSEADLFTDEDRAHWAFQPIRAAQPPRPQQDELVETPIDAFLLARLEQQQLSFSPAADRPTLVRRLYMDLVGLPPAPDELARVLSDASPLWYERLVDRLLASPAYGERWGRHWLDVAGYADSEGYTVKDVQRPWAWRYRDYVIRALNADRSWRDLIVEQLAGDELVGPPYEDLAPQQADALIATGFLRMAPDGTADGSADKKVAANEVLAETIKITSTALLGLTVGCAQCHDHRYDPISHKDYHRFRAIFEPAYDWTAWRAPRTRLVSLWSAETRQRAAEVEQQLKQLAADRTAALDKIVEETFERELAKLPSDVQPLARQAREAPAAKRTPEQQQLIKKYPFLNVDRGSVYLYLPDRLNGFKKEWDARTEQLNRQRPEEDFVRCLNEVPGKVPKTYLFTRGDIEQPAEEIAPGRLAVLAGDSMSIPEDDPQRPTSGRRLAYARHLTDGSHPLVARVLVNRFWMHHFGQGIVRTPGDFGILGDPPSHPELLDYLADWFMQADWRLKPLQRMIVLSTAYRQSSQRQPAHEAADPENRLVSRMPVRRLESEAVRDAVLAVSGSLVNRSFGKPAPVTPDDVGQIIVGIDNRDSAGRPRGKRPDLGADEFRRSIYVEVRRSMPLGVLEPFDAPIMAPNCTQRASSTVAPQSLLMMNSPFVVAQATQMADRVRRQAGSDVEAQLRAAWQLAFSAEPSADDVAAGIEFLQVDLQAGEDAEAAAQTRLAHLCQALLCSTRFLYVQ